MFSTTLEDVEKHGFILHSHEIDEAIQMINSEEVENKMDITFKNQSTIYLYSATVLSHKSNEKELRALIPTLLFYDSLSTAKFIYRTQLETGASVLFSVAIPVEKILDTLSPYGIREVNEVWKKDKGRFKDLSAQQIILSYAKNRYLAVRLSETKKVSKLFIPSIQYTYYKIVSDIGNIQIEFQN